MTSRKPPRKPPDNAPAPHRNGAPVLRFAPSPNGELHLGHALSALTGYAMARRLGGRFLLRIEDIDRARCRPEYIDGIFRDLAWLGITWEEPVWRQSDRFDVYKAAAKKLEVQGLIYPCFATRSEIQAAAIPGALDPDGAPLYPGLGRHLPAAEVARRKSTGEAYALRLDMAAAVETAGRLGGGTSLSFVSIDELLRHSQVAANPDRWGDAVILRKDVPASYHLAVVVDDAAQGVTHVVRGRDLLAATDLHRLLQVLLGLAPPAYHHHRLIADETGRKLSKSYADISLRQLREAGVCPAGIGRLIGFDLENS